MAVMHMFYMDLDMQVHTQSERIKFRPVNPFSVATWEIQNIQIKIHLALNAV